MKYFLRVLGAFIAAALIMGGFIWWSTRVPERGGDFTLMSEKGSWQFKEQARKTNLLYVGYAKCPDVCPMTLSHLADAYRDLTEQEKAQVQVVFLSVDADHDTAESVATYAKQFNPDFVGLTGTRAQIDEVMRLVGASYMVEKDPKSYLGYSIAHTDKVFFLNKKGIVKDEEPMVRSKDMVLEKIRGLL